jgi:hypothetical protein
MSAMGYATDAGDPPAMIHFVTCAPILKNAHIVIMMPPVSIIKEIPHVPSVSYIIFEDNAVKKVEGQSQSTTLINNV